ncbi:replication termination factor 2 isoform X2 [Falco biarmicus]|uniref:replication termination factor 2 isoform X2 n=1 Tax=Falco rusticolus TaxID=120794 RepID=UPI0018866709|nr:replication termination factor 2 isoform X2 [Falco rusticolus]XP_055577762.1 replication termination factor 2 isoform X2 [Falco cherrug]XP_056209415.1 replication termination factor 2 isoform X2 [Falco biarmicus]
MGCDGGTIPKRHELVKGPRKVEKVDKNAELVARWYYCALSQEKLCRPIVACELGRLYNKDAIIEFLLEKSADKTPMEAASHIKSIKNVTELNLADNPAWSGDKESIKGDKYDDIQSARFICPVVGLEMNGRHRFCFLRNCGCVFSERALKEIKSEVCHKKSKKCKSAESASQQDTTEDCPGPSKAKSGKDCINSSSGEKRQIIFTKSSDNGNSSVPVKVSKAASTTTKRSIADSEEKSEAYKSIFTSHSSAKRSKEECSNWITHTAYYF